MKCEDSETLASDSPLDLSLPESSTVLSLSDIAKYLLGVSLWSILTIVVLAISSAVLFQDATLANWLATLSRWLEEMVRLLSRLV